MNILGVIGFFNNPAACILVDGKLIAMAEEERFTRYKNSMGFVPVNAIKYCLKEAGLKINEVGKIAWGFDANFYSFKMPLYSLYLWLKHIGLNKSNHSKRLNIDANPSLSYLEILLKLNKNTIKYNFVQALRLANIQGRIPDIEFVPHHLAHAASVYYSSGWDKASILIMDGMGENKSSSLWLGEGLKIKNLKYYRFPNSLGEFYAAFTEFMAFLPYSDEGKFMGLAAYGKWNKNLEKKFNHIIKFAGKYSYKVNPAYTLLGNHSYGERFSDTFIELFGLPKEKPVDFSEEEKEIAYMAQKSIEKAGIRLTKEIIYKTGIKKLCIGGGVGMNCKMNGEILQNSGIEEIFLIPTSNDAGTCLGAAMFVSAKAGYDPRFKMEHPYWGPEFSNEEIERMLTEYKIKFAEPKNISAQVAKDIAESKIVGWFQGRMEMGARALGHRSILANPKIKNMSDIVNNKVKHREPWRPFAPSILAERADKYLVNGCESPFMIVAFKAKPGVEEEIPAVVHVDGTVRAQTVRKDINPEYYNLIYEFEKLTGTGVILNTSFNVKGEPIICTPSDAIRCFFGTGMDCLAIGKYYVQK